MAPKFQVQTDSGCSSTPGLFRPYSFQNILGTSVWTKNSILCMILYTGSALQSAIMLVSILSLPLKAISVTADLSSSVKDKYSRAVRSITREKWVLSINRNQLLCDLCTFFLHVQCPDLERSMCCRNRKALLFDLSAEALEQFSI